MMAKQVNERAAWWIGMSVLLFFAMPFWLLLIIWSANQLAHTGIAYSFASAVAVVVLLSSFVGLLMVGTSRNDDATLWTKRGVLAMEKIARGVTIADEDGPKGKVHRA